MKNLLGTVSCTILTSLVLFNNANASCAIPPASTPSSFLVENPGNFLRFQTVCVTFREKSQEFHQAGSSTATGGNIVDYKRGPDPSIDPTKTIGTWASNVTDHTVTYTYPTPTGPKSYTYNMYIDTTVTPTTISYCNGTNGAGDIPIDAVLFGQSDACPE